MATFIQDPNYPHVIGFYGTDVVNENNNLRRANVKNILFSNNNPLGNLEGKVDFIICFVVDAPVGNYASVDETLLPRPLRGIIQLPKDLQMMTLTELGGLLGGGIGHEVGHYWLVPGQARIRTPTGEVETPTTDDIWMALNQGNYIPRYPIMARQDSHWSPYIHGDNSMMDSINHGSVITTPGIGFLGRSGRYTQLNCESGKGPTIELPGEGQIDTDSQYSLLDRWIMGDYIPPSHTAHGKLWPNLKLIEPRWAFPLTFQAGLYFELDNGDAWYLGFDRGPHQFRASRVDGGDLTNTLSVPTNPLDPYIQTGFRIVQQDNEVHMQIRVWSPGGFSGCLTAFLPWFHRVRPNISCNTVMADLASGALDTAKDFYTGWHTIKTVQGGVNRMGLSTRTFGNPTYALLSANLCQYSSNQIYSISVLDLDEQIPKAGPRRLSNGKIMMPYATADGISTYSEDVSTQDAPKWTTEAPVGDFAFGGVLDLEACAMVNWAGRGAISHTLIGTQREVSFEDFILPWTQAVSAIKRSDPYNNKYKMMFCVTSRTQAQIVLPDMLQNLDRVRRAWEIYFSTVTSRHADTLIDYT